MPKFAFRCKNCRLLVEAGAAGEREVPRGCPQCNAGGHWELEAGIPKFVDEPENWTVLADLDVDDLEPVLKFHKIEAKDIERHVPLEPTTPTREPQNIEVTAGDNLGQEDHA